MIRILQTVSNMDRGGIETMLMNFYRHMDRDLVQFDFLQNKPNPGDYDEEIRALGGRLFVSPGYRSYKNYMAYMTKLFSEHPEYQILHTHNGALMIYALHCAKKNGIPVRIAHAHSTSVPMGWKNEFKKLMRPMIKYEATDYWGCSNAAGKFYFSEKRWNASHELIHNAINLSDFTYNEEARASLRRQYGLGDRFVIGHVGRLSAVKNQKMALEVFAELYKRNQNTQLVIVGTGELENALKQRAKELGIAERVTFTGVQSNVNEWYSVFDVFMMNSFYEGLPVVAVEAQAADLPCVLSDAITPEVKVTDNVQFLNIRDGAAVWADKILKLPRAPRRSRAAELQAAGYDIALEAKKMQDLYLKLYEEIKGRNG